MITLAAGGWMLAAVVMALLWARDAQKPQVTQDADYRPAIKRTLAIGFAVFILSSFAYWAAVRGLYGDKFAGYAGHHIRFGPRSTSNKE